MTAYYFDVNINGKPEADTIGSEVPREEIERCAADLALRLALDRLPQASDISVRVRTVEGRQVYEATISVAGEWKVNDP